MHIGGVLAGKYRVDRILGQGGMGIVVQATHLQLGTQVAVKFLLPEVLGNQEVVQRFLREAQAAVRLKSEHVARVIDVGSLETGAPYIVLEYLEGVELSRVPRAELEGGGLVDLMLQACEALFEAHSIGIVHRDIKPANLFVIRHADGSPTLKILDFGISKSQGAIEGNLTATAAVMGTPAYMSPEQMRSSRDVDGRSDIWSLGVVMYELFEGIPPFQAESFTAFAIKVVTEPLPPMKRQLPPGLANVVYRCLEKDRDRRFSSVSELAAALAPFSRSPTQRAVTLQRTGGGSFRHASAPTIAATPPHGTTLSSATGAITPAPTTRARWPIFAGLGVVATAGVAVALVMAGSKSAPAPTPVAQPAPAPTPTPTPTPAPPDAAVAVAPPPVDAGVVTVVTPDAAVVPTTTATKRPTHSHKPTTTTPAAGSANADDDILGARH